MYIQNRHHIGISDLNRTSKQKADDMKRQIRDKIGNMLGKFSVLPTPYLIYGIDIQLTRPVEITGDDKVLMQYTHHDELVQKYGVELQGWTFEKLVNPSQLSTSLPGLRCLLDAINNGDCKFVKLSPLEIKKRHEELQKKRDEGTVPVKTRKPRKDRGTKRPRTKGKKKAGDDADDDDEEPDEEEAERPCKRRSLKSAETIPAEIDN